MIPTKLKPLMNSIMKKVNRIKLYLCYCSPCFLYKNSLNKHYNILLNDIDTLENDTLENDTNNSYYNHFHTFSYPHDIDNHSDLYIEYDTYDNDNNNIFY